MVISFMATKFCNSEMKQSEGTFPWWFKKKKKKNKNKKEQKVQLQREVPHQHLNHL